MAVKITITTDPPIADAFEAIGEKWQKQFTAAVNMAASMIEEQARAEIAGSGNFGTRWTSGLHVNVDGALGNMVISMTNNQPGADVFALGGTIHGSPLLWIPLSGTDAEGVEAKDYPGKLFSVNRKSGGVPLLFSIADKSPKYFGIESVTIPQKWNLRDVELSVMANFREIFESAANGI